MTVESWPGRGFYRGNKQAMLNDMAKLFDGTMIATVALEQEAPKLELAKIEVEQIAPTEPGDPRSRGYTGNTCSNCNSTRMITSGHCEVCGPRLN